MKLLFGSESFIAKNISADIKISKSECDLLDINQVTTILEKYKPTGVINCAAAHGSAKAMSQNQIHYLEHNILMDLNRKILFDDYSFDYVFCLDIMEHLDDPISFLKETMITDAINKKTPDKIFFER